MDSPSVWGFIDICKDVKPNPRLVPGLEVGGRDFKNIDKCITLKWKADKK